MTGFLEALEERGLFHQSTERGELDKRLANGERITGYVGVDPTADSCHVGHLVQVMALAHFQRAGHRPILLMGGGTGRIGDPSGKTEMRRMLGEEQIDANVRTIREQLGRYLDLAEPGVTESEGNRGLVLNNADWILGLNYVDFLREIGRHFSVNRMLTAESVRLRLESEAGLSFLEFNYSLLQAYDFLVLHRKTGCEMQIGGSDQWGNIVAGVDLIRRVEAKPAYAVTTPLVMTSDGKKMGKTEKGAVWLDPRKTSPYDYYQYWVNVADADVIRLLGFYTFLERAEIDELARLEGADIRRAKEVLAVEATALTHGREEAEAARKAAKSVFYGGDASGEVPTYRITSAALDEGIVAPKLFCDAGLCDSRGAARRLAKQGGLYVHGESVAEDRVIGAGDLEDGAILLRAGKKKHRRVIVEG